MESQDINVIDKPCDISIIENENKYLKDYFDMYDNQDIDNQDIDDVEKLKQKYNDLDILIKSLIAERPNKVNKIDKPNRAKKECLTNINNLFGNLEYLHKIIEDISNISNLNKSAKSNKHDSVSLRDLSLDNYKKYLQDKDNLEKNIENYNAKLRDNDEYLNKYFKEQENLKMLNVNVNVNAQQHYDSIDINQYVNAEEIMKDIKKIDYNYILRFLNANEESVEKYNEIKGRLKDVEEDKLKYVEELMLLETNEEYHYNPSCEYCCRRSWVNRIKELQIIIQHYEEDIDNIKNELDSNIDYDGLVEKMNRFKTNKNNYEILQERYAYLEYNEERERINKKINEALENKKEYSKAIDENNKELENIKTYILIYYNKAIELRENLDNIISYDKFKKWEDNYNEYVNKIQEIDNKIRKSVEILNYNKNIKPRIITHRKLVEQYNKWEKYNINTNIIRSREYLDIKEIIENYRNNEVYKNYIEMKPIIKRTLELKNIIKEGEDNIQKNRDDITEKVAIFNYNKSNIKSLTDLRDILDNINNMLTTLDTIILNFQDFRINLYDKIILNKLLHNTNNMLKNICHSMTKPFELDYIINVSRDMIHINWLIKNVNIDASKGDNNDCKTKQIISINQASGFQQFVISLALRLCLFGNNKAICKQLYIDEGFVSFDKYNLSIVPNFLRSLLAYFDTIIIVSHIDLIQETIEDNECIAEINYNSTTSVSSITYKKILDIASICKANKKKNSM
jgi:DNA repair exonuclease SbcCD ATPase subunit